MILSETHENGDLVGVCLSSAFNSVYKKAQIPFEDNYIFLMESATLKNHRLIKLIKISVPDATFTCYDYKYCF